MKALKFHLISTNRHGDDLCLEGSCNLRYFDLGANSLVGFHIEALNSICAIDFGEE